jgi:hypothetical protein
MKRVICGNNIEKFLYPEHDKYRRSLIGYEDWIGHESRVNFPPAFKIVLFHNTVAKYQPPTSRNISRHAKEFSCWNIRSWFSNVIFWWIANNTKCLNKRYISIPPYLEFPYDKICELSSIIRNQNFSLSMGANLLTYSMEQSPSWEANWFSS